MDFSFQYILFFWNIWRQSPQDSATQVRAIIGNSLFVRQYISDSVFAWWNPSLIVRWNSNELKTVHCSFNNVLPYNIVKLITKKYEMTMKMNKSRKLNWNIWWWNFVFCWLLFEHYRLNFMACLFWNILLDWF